MAASGKKRPVSSGSAISTITVQLPLKRTYSPNGFSQAIILILPYGFSRLD